MKLGENLLRFTQVIVLKWKYGCGGGRQLCQKLTKFAHEQSQTRSLQYQCTHQVWWKSIDIYSLLSGNKKSDMSQQITLSEIDEYAHKQSFSRSPQYQCMYQVWWTSIDIHSSYHPEMKIRTDGSMIDRRSDEQISTWNHNTPPLSCGKV